jgi:hypothetical protein
MDLVRFAHNWNDGKMEYWNIGSQRCIALKKINQGFKKLGVWQNATALYVLA